MTGEPDVPPPDSLVTVMIDPDACIGSGTCELLEPDTFVVDDDEAIAVISGTGRLSRAAAEKVIDRCPSGAIRIVTAGEAAEAEPATTPNEPSREEPGA